MRENESPEDRTLGDVIREGATRHRAPAALRARIAAATAVAAAQAGSRPAPPPRPAWAWRGFAIGVTAFACGALASWLALALLHDVRDRSRIDDEVVSAHVRGTMLARAVDVASSDQHTVKPWLSSRLDFSPAVVDLAADGFPLAGARLDYVGGRTVAALVYQRRKHWIDVFAWPAGNTSGGEPVAGGHNGFNTLAWTQGGVQYRAVSDIAAGELGAFAALLRQRGGE